jgi:hypothetical protein
VKIASEIEDDFLFECIVEKDSEGVAEVSEEESKEGNGYPYP